MTGIAKLHWHSRRHGQSTWAQGLVQLDGCNARIDVHADYPGRRSVLHAALVAQFSSVCVRVEDRIEQNEVAGTHLAAVGERKRLAPQLPRLQTASLCHAVELISLSI